MDVLLDVAISKNKAIRATVKTAAANRETGASEPTADEPKSFWTNAE